MYEPRFLLPPSPMEIAQLTGFIRMSRGSAPSARLYHVGVLLKASTVLLGMSVVLGLVSISLVLETEPTNYYAVLAFFLCLMVGG